MAKHNRWSLIPKSRVPEFTTELGSSTIHRSKRDSDVGVIRVGTEITWRRFSIWVRLWNLVVRGELLRRLMLKSQHTMMRLYTTITASISEKKLSTKLEEEEGGL